LPRDPDAPLRFRTLYTSPLVRVSDYECRAGRGGPGAEEETRTHDIVLLRRGVFCKHVGRHALTADVNHALFFAKGSTYRVSHPIDCGDRGTVFTPSAQTLYDALDTLDPRSADRADAPFAFTSGPCEPDVFWRHREFLARLQIAHAQPLDPMWADATALQLIGDLLSASIARHGSPPHRHRRATMADHANRVEAIKAHLATRLGDPITLEDAARAVHTSPFHLARIFRAHTGVPIHRYLVRLRLRASLERLADGAGDLTALAHDLGFASHSHFADSFRREFGRSPSAVRRAMTRTTLGKMRKNPEA
jgi:AraC family transcriptional regulator